MPISPAELAEIKAKFTEHLQLNLSEKSRAALVNGDDVNYEQLDKSVETGIEEIHWEDESSPS